VCSYDLDTDEHHVLYKLYVKCGSNRKYWRKFCHELPRNTLPSTKGINKLTTNVKFYGLPRNLLENTIRFLKKKLDDIWARSEHTPQKSLRSLAQVWHLKIVSSHSYKAA
jgi:hypothetical protein